MAKPKKTKKKAKAKDTNPVWNKEMVTTWEEVETSVLSFYRHFNLPVDPILLSVEAKMKTGGIYTLEDQRLVSRLILADMAAQVREVFTDPILAGVVVGCAESLADANRNKK